MLLKLGEFLKSEACLSGLNAKDGLDFIKNQIKSNESQGQNAKDNRNIIIEQYDLELHTYISQKVKAGESPNNSSGLKALIMDASKKRSTS